MYGIATFDKVKEYDNITSKYSHWSNEADSNDFTLEPEDIDVWGEPRRYGYLRKYQLPELLELYRKSGRLSKQKECNLIAMLNSQDREDWYIAFLTIKQIRKL